jgi:hypothetical protein
MLQPSDSFSSYENSLKSISDCSDILAFRWGYNKASKRCEYPLDDCATVHIPLSYFGGFNKQSWHIFGKKFPPNAAQPTFTL